MLRMTLNNINLYYSVLIYLYLLYRLLLHLIQRMHLISNLLEIYLCKVDAANRVIIHRFVMYVKRSTSLCVIFLIWKLQK